MKYIKLYEDFYKLIDDSQDGRYEFNISGKIISIDDKTISEIRKIEDSCAKYSNDDGNEYVEIIRPFKKHNRGKLNRICQLIFIWQYEDEWYEVQSLNTDDTTTTYWCDQLEGLIKCLKEI